MINSLITEEALGKDGGVRMREGAGETIAKDKEKVWVGVRGKGDKHLNS